MNDEQKAIAKAVAREALDEFIKERPCFFTTEERATLHAFHEVMGEEEANHGTLRIIVQFGKSFQDITKTLRRAGLLLLLLILAVLGLRLSAQSWKFWG
jgi:hypothetical protein